MLIIKKENTRQHPAPSAIAELRERADLTRKEVGILLQVNPSTVWRWETGAAKMQASIFELFCMRLKKAGVDVALPEVTE